MFSFLATITEVVTGPISPGYVCYNNRVDKSRNYRIPAFSIIGRLIHILIFPPFPTFSRFLFFLPPYLFLNKTRIHKHKKEG